MVDTGHAHVITLYTYSMHIYKCIVIKPEPIMLLVLPIVPSRISHNLFLFYSHAITYYSCYVL